MKKLILILLFLPILLPGLEYDLTHEFKLSGVYSWNKEETRSSGYYRPELYSPLFSGKVVDFDGELSPIFQFTLTPDTNFEADIYRGWLRASSTNWFLRIGRQKINFGSASFLRPLQWFDNIDPVDPLKQSSGADAALTRLYTEGASFWFWSVG